ncbi:uncharacterized protein LOC116032081 [Ipomoea triloba]|uniref:uncharacterized protein LOC116032081 n=1 Tax=Ipomoea triloba TaxID=35885 RepID=UPI00125D1B7F|nr:uncharacterized protein LOC116032081 [Ipomoea triloba]
MGGRAQVNKAHKTRFSSKSSRNVHKVPSQDKGKWARPERNVLKGARATRLQRNKMIREQKKAALLKEKRASSGSDAPPRVIVLFGLSASLDLCSLEQDILTLLSAEGTSSGFPAVASSEFKLRATVCYAPMCYYFLIIYLPSWYFTFEMINVQMDLLMFKEMNPFLCRYSLV